MLRALAVLIAFAAWLALPAAASADATYDHVVLVVMENHARSQLTASNAPFLTGVGSEDTGYQAVTHPSLPNYMALTSGATQGCTSDTCPVNSLNVPNVFAQLGTDARSLAESMPATCYRRDARPYVAHHNPEVYYSNAPCDTQVVPLAATPDISARLTFVVPNVVHDMHSTDITSADTWASQFEAQLEAQPQWTDPTQRTAIVWTFDEGVNTNQTILLAVKSNQGTSADINVRASHPDLLNTILTVLGQPLIGPGNPSLLLPLFPAAGTPPCALCDPPCDPTPCPPPPADPGVISSSSETPAVATKNVEVDFHLESSAPV